MVDYRDDARWTVYIHIVPKKISGYDHDKYYVGITSRKPEERWGSNGCRYKTQIFYRAINKYKWDNIIHEIIAEKLTHAEACQLEMKLIAELKSNDVEYGYNYTSGGEGTVGLTGEKSSCWGRKLTDEQKQHLSNVHKGKKLSKEHVEKTRKKLKEKWQNEEYRKLHSGENAPSYGRTGDKHPMYGKHGSEIANSKQVICLNTKEIFESAMDAAKSKKVNHSKLCMCCRGERYLCGKNENGEYYSWMFYDDYLNSSEEDIILRIRKANDMSFKRPNNINAIVNIENHQLYSSAKIAAQVNNLKSFARINQACNDTSQTAYKHHWMYYKDYLKLNNLTDKEAYRSLFFVA